MEINGIPVEKVIERNGMKVYIVVAPPKESGYTLNECVNAVLELYPDLLEITISFPSYYPRKPDSWSEAQISHEREFSQVVDDLHQATEACLNLSSERK